MAVSKLEIRPEISGSGKYKRQVKTLENHFKQMDKNQSKALTRGVREGRLLERQYKRIGRSIGGAANMSRNLVSSLLSMKGLMAGVLLGGAGKTFFDMTIGSAAQVEKTSKLLKLVLKDEEKMLVARKKANELVKEVASLDFNSALGGIQNMFKLGDEDLGKAKGLVKTAQALTALKPDKSFQDALFSIKELETGDTTSLRGAFGVKLPGKDEAEKAAKAAKTSIKTYYIDALDRAINDQVNEKGKGSGVDALLKIDRESLTGKTKMIRTSISDMFRSVGTEAMFVAQKQLPALKKELDTLQADPQFKTDIREFTMFLADATKDAFKLARALPEGFRKARDFSKEYGTYIKLAVGLLAANKITGGGVTSLAGMGARGALGAGRVLLGRSASLSGIAGTLGKASATPVYVVNMGESMGGEKDDYLARNAGKAAGAVNVGLGAGTATTVAGGGVIAGSFAFGAYTLVKAINDTSKVVKNYEAAALLAAAREDEARKVRRTSAQADAARNQREALSPHLRNRRMLGKRVSALGTLSGLGKGQSFRGGVNSLFGGADTEFTGSEDQMFALNALNAELKNQSLSLSLQKGQTIGDARLAGGLGVMNKNNPGMRKQLLELAKIQGPFQGATPLNAEAARIRQAADQAAGTASVFNSSREGVRADHLAKNINFNFHGSVTDPRAAGAEAAAGFAAALKNDGVLNGN